MGWDEITSQSAHLSLSQIAMFKRCPKQWEYRYVQGIKSPPSSSLFLGTSVHSGIEHNYAAKFKTKKQANKNEVLDAYDAAYNDAGTDLLSAVEKEKFAKSKDQGYRMVELHYTELAPAVQPVAAPEYEFKLKLPNVRREVVGYVDVKGTINKSKRPFIIDNKTGARKYQQFDVDLNLQLRIYRMAEAMAHGTLENVEKYSENGVIDAMIRNKGGVMTQRLYSLESFDINRVIDLIVKVEQAIDAGLFWPCEDPQTRSWCGYNKLCHKAAVERKEMMANSWD